MQSPLSPRECGRRLYVAILSCIREDAIIAETDEYHSPDKFERFWEDMAGGLMDIMRPTLTEAELKPAHAGTKGLSLVWSQPAENIEPPF